MSRIIRFTVEALLAIASLALLILVGVVTVDVIARNAGLFHVRGVTDVMAIALMSLAGAAIPVAFVTGRHLVVEIGTYRLSSRSKTALEGVWLLLAAPLLGWLGWLVLSEGLHMAARNRTMGVMSLSPNTFHMPVAAGLLAAALACFVVALFRFAGRSEILAAPGSGRHGKNPN